MIIGVTKHEQELRDQRQLSIFEWARRAFAGKDLAEVGSRTRAIRFFEEAVELLQAHGLEYEDLRKVMDYVWTRPVGEVKQELGGVMITLQAYAQSLDGISLSHCEDIEIDRINFKPLAHFQKRQQEKREAGL